MYIFSIDEKAVNCYHKGSDKNTIDGVFVSVYSRDPPMLRRM